MLVDFMLYLITYIEHNFVRPLQYIYFIFSNSKLFIISRAAFVYRIYLMFHFKLNISLFGIRYKINCRPVSYIYEDKVLFE